MSDGGHGPALPDGYVRTRHGKSLLVSAAAAAGRLRGAGLDTPAGWLSRLDASGPEVRGRGGAVTVREGGETPLTLKPLRRGGWLRELWRDRFVGVSRARANLTVPVEAARRGVATPVPLALLLVPGPPLLWRAWLALPRVEPGIDLHARLASGRALADRDWSSLVDALREMHRQGLEHRDLNLGNILVQEREPARYWILDLDRARLHDGPTPFGAVQSALRRLERSYVKAFGPQGPEASRFRGALYRDYAAGDPVLAAGLELARQRNEATIARHRKLWRAGGD